MTSTPGQAAGGRSPSSAAKYADGHVALGASAAAGVTGFAALLALRWRRLSRHHAALGLATAAVLLVALVLHLLGGTVFVWLRNDMVAGSLRTRRRP